MSRTIWACRLPGSSVVHVFFGDRAPADRRRSCNSSADPMRLIDLGDVPAEQITCKRCLKIEAAYQRRGHYIG